MIREEIKVQQIVEAEEHKIPLNQFGDNMEQFMWDGPEDSDEEIEGMAKLKMPWEIESGVKFSKNGLIEFITKFLDQESPFNEEDPACAKLWEQKLKMPGLQYYLKRGGSNVDKN